MTDRTGDAPIDDFFTTARTAARTGAVELPADSYLDYLLPLDDTKLTSVRGMDYNAFAEDRYRAPFLRDLLAYWDSLYTEPFVGVTNDGSVQPGLFRAVAQADDVAVEARRAAVRVLALMTDAEREQYRYPIDAPEWRGWSNPEFVIYRVGLRLEDLPGEKIAAILELMRTSLSPDGYQRVREAMDLNEYLGELVDLPTVMNSRSYWVALFGDPENDRPWGWQIFGHHVAVNCVWVDGRQVVAPVFLGGEPALSESAQLPLFADRERMALELAASLTAQQRDRAVVYESVLDPAMPEGRVHPADERHLAGAFHDNWVIPYEGIAAGDLDATQQALLQALIEDALLLLPAAQRRLTMADVDHHLTETHFCWYGAIDGSTPFYFRVQSPVVITELDHHAGVWLTNKLPARFHVHTTLRIPNGGDYGKAYLALSERDERAESSGGAAPSG